MTTGDALGWAACLMTLVTFAQRQMLPLRVAAILANPFFIGYAASATTSRYLRST